MNVPALLITFKALYNPTLILPHATIPHLSHLPIPVSHAFAPRHPSPSSSTLSPTEKAPSPPDIRAIVLDKDNCFALPQTSSIHPSCAAAITSLKSHYPSAALLIVSNTAGYTRRDSSLAQARALEAATGIPVLTHEHPKPHRECWEEILAHFRERGVVERAGQIAVVGDRLCTDVAMANGMGAWGVWVREGVRRDTGIWTRAEWVVEEWLRGRGWKAEVPE